MTPNHTIKNNGNNKVDDEENEQLNNSIESLKEKIFYEPNEAINYFNLAILLNNRKNKSITLVDDVEMDQKQLYIKSYNLDNSFVGSLNNLSTLLNNPEEVVYLNEENPSMNRFDLAKLVYELDSNYSNICHNLAVFSKTKSTITLSNGTTINNKQLYSKAISTMSPSECWKSYYGLYFELEDDEDQVMVLEETNNISYSKKEILIKILSLIKDHSLLDYYNNYYNSAMSVQLSTVYYSLSNYLQDESSSIQLPNIQDFDINNTVDPSLPAAAIVGISAANTTINMNKKDLLVESLKYNPSNYNVMLELSQIMNNQELIPLFIDGASKSMCKVDILFLLINIDLDSEINQSIVLKANQLYQNIKW
ncbi:hypothetical protein DICPUDRAFT_153345 [Dictyostelium purpureum]|uniref:Uncharacterized protein n=1 Tax=Dictyostelium purpureum TaxID=5786 RepID=F0ZNN4_DICPU|nr:uncharacterized protein DICPUDRAFT_153345 [Dictyostelium purpureum]EGC34441.1 hypothetical protein DICPUDRAFT_153345 [Dictyostelium purpureum]|eukprot:XP_003289026.1 hypothetical protein DICPUDRAFT_153345 [Dictyostelium purpureum]